MLGGGAGRVAALGLLGLVGCGASTPGVSGPDGKPPVEQGSIRLILNDPGDLPGPPNECKSELCTSLVTLLDAAEESVDFAIYGMRNQSDVLGALRRAKERGVKVRGIVDRDHEGKNYYSSTPKLVALLGDDLHSDYEIDVQEVKDEKDYFGKSQCKRPAGFEGPVQCLMYDLGPDKCLVAAHASREPLGGSGSIMHNKFFIVDGQKLWTGSTNVSDSGTGGYNANLVTVVESSRVAGWYTVEFEQMYDAGRYHKLKEARPEMKVRLGDATLEVLFSPQDRPITRRVREILRGAKKKIDVAVFFLTHKGITADLIRAHLAGVQVRVIIDATAAKNGYSKHELLRAAGIPVKIETWGGKMHMKSGAVDGETVITGSMNWTTAGESGNDENTILVSSQKHAAQYHQFFDRVWDGLGDDWLQGRPDPESKASGAACTDGVDNDYDHQADAEDPGCTDDPPPLPALPPWRIVRKKEGMCEVDDPNPLQTSPPETQRSAGEKEAPAGERPEIPAEDAPPGEGSNVP